MKWLATVATFLVLPVLATTALAQDDGTIAYGQTVLGEITNREFEIEYTFTGSAGDVIVIEMKPVEVLGDLDAPVIMVLGAEYNPLWDAGSYGDAVLAAVLPYDGEYVILATRGDGRAGDSVGEYTLTLSNVPMLEPGVPVEGEVSSEGTVFYAADATQGPVTIVYEKEMGEFFPEVTFNVIDDGELDDIAAMTGEFLSGSLTIDPSYVPGDILVISLQEALWDWNFTEVRASFTLVLEQ